MDTRSLGAGGTPHQVMTHLPDYDNNTQLILNDGSKTLIARFHRRSLGLFGTKGPRPAYLEIVPGYESMADLIFFTFVYIEKIRKDKERAA